MVFTIKRKDTGLVLLTTESHMESMYAGHGEMPFLHIFIVINIELKEFAFSIFTHSNEYMNALVSDIEKLKCAKSDWRKSIDDDKYVYYINHIDVGREDICIYLREKLNKFVEKYQDYELVEQ